MGFLFFSVVLLFCISKSCFAFLQPYPGRLQILEKKEKAFVVDRVHCSLLDHSLEPLESICWNYMVPTNIAHFGVLLLLLLSTIKF